MLRFLSDVARVVSAIALLGLACLASFYLIRTSSMNPVFIFCGAMGIYTVVVLLMFQNWDRRPGAPARRRRKQREREQRALRDARGEDAY